MKAFKKVLTDYVQLIVVLASYYGAFRIMYYLHPFKGFDPFDLIIWLVAFVGTGNLLMTILMVFVGPRGEDDHKTE